MTKRSDKMTVEIVRLYRSSPESVAGWALNPAGQVFIFHCDLIGERVRAEKQLYLNHPQGHPNKSTALSKERAAPISAQIWAALLCHPRQDNGHLVLWHGSDIRLPGRMANDVSVPA